MVRNMTDFCESFVYENDSTTVSDLAELYNKGIKPGVESGCSVPARPAAPKTFFFAFNTLSSIV